MEAAPPAEEPAVEVFSDLPRRSVAFIGSECHPFVKTGGLGDVMYALPRELVRLNCDVRVILPRYACIPQKYQEKMVYRGEFYMDLGKTGRQYYVGIMEYVCDGVVYDFIDNQEFFSSGNPYINLVDDIPKYCFFSKAALAALNFMNWIPDIVHCHDWQAALVPVYLRTLFKDSPVGKAKSILTIHNLRFQGIYNIPTIQYWSGLPSEVFNMGALKEGYEDANMLKGGLAYADRITTVSGTYAQEIQTSEYGEHLEGHLRYHNYKLRGIVNGIDYGMWNPETDPALAVNYGLGNVLEHKMENKLALQKELGLEQDEGKFVLGLISRLTNQKGLDLVSAVIPQVLDGNTQIVVLGTGDKVYEDTFRGYEDAYKGTFSACIQYDESRAHRIYAGADALLVPSRFEPCGLTQLNAMHYGTLPIVAGDRRPEGHRGALQHLLRGGQRLYLRPVRIRPAAGRHQPGQDAVLYQPLPLGRGGPAGYGEGRLLGELRQTVQRPLPGADPVVKRPPGPLRAAQAGRPLSRGPAGFPFRRPCPSWGNPPQALTS